MKVLLTGFNRFGDLQMNPSQIIVEEIASRKRHSSDISVIAKVLPTEFNAAGSRIQELIGTIKPDVFLGLGVAVERNILNIERVALNLDDSTLPDNSGLCPEGKRIVEDGPPAYFSNLPLLYLRDKLKEKGVPIKISNHAGTYVCNHVFYLAQHQVNISKMDTMCGFIHVPLVSDQDSPFEHHKITLFKLVVIIENCLRLLKDLRKVNVT